MRLALISTATFVAFSVPLSAGQWEDQRAGLFSDVCMASAPGFGDLGAAASEAGFLLIDGRAVYQPEVVLSLRETETICECAMTMGAPDPVTLFSTVVARLDSDHALGLQDVSDGPTLETRVQKDGDEVQLTLKPEIIDGDFWLTGRVASEGACG